MSDIKYLSYRDVLDVAVDKEHPRNPYSSGYGRKIPTQYKLTLKNKRTYRVYIMQYSNSGSTYILQKGEVFFLDSDTEHTMEAARDFYEKGE